jgi:hypothetical protein
MCSDDYDLPEFYDQQVRKARKAYRCCECGTVIPAGEVYEATTGKWDGEVRTFHTHKACADLWEFVHHVACGGFGGILHGGLAEEISEAAEYLDIDRDAWEAIGVDCVNPLRDVFEEIQAHYREVSP